ncbi:MAG: sigma-70 family RNA polymerase sigma factor [Dehalococcoidia bacterium]|nr:sigma-70 family RNA polymerase sigma factor [Dehalococcoidia bacterium]MDD5494803.1 sigma-70 family RNA polymerase sigma factor [Dehalococcoidia bacterium]
MLIEEQIVQRAVNGDREAFTALYDMHFDKIYRYIYVKVRSQAEAEDLTQDVFIKAYEAIKSYKWRDLPFTAWLFKIAHNRVIDHVRKTSKEKKTGLEEAGAIASGDPVYMTEQNFEIYQLKDALEKLPDAQREVATLRFISELSIAEVAVTLGKSEGTVKALQFNAIASLRKLLYGKIDG